MGEKVGDGFRVKYYKVWNIEQLEKRGKLESLIPETQPAPKVVMLDAVAAMGIKVVPGNLAAYLRHSDEIVMPALASFDSGVDYDDTLAHELVHATGHISRINRDTLYAPEVKANRAMEELIAELGAAILLAQAGIVSDTLTENNAAYIAVWLQLLKDNPYAIITAASKASQAVAFINKSAGVTAVAAEPDVEQEAA
jgi:antirestriction protein ArdC